MPLPVEKPSVVWVRYPLIPPTTLEYETPLVAMITESQSGGLNSAARLHAHADCIVASNRLAGQFCEESVRSIE